MKRLKDALLDLKGQNVDFAIASGVLQGILREVEEDYVVFYKDEKTNPTLFLISNLIWIRKAVK
jgi:6-pyruvoyl-tetrahydropterin synthase